MTRKSIIHFTLFFIILIIPFGLSFLLFYCLIRYIIFGKKFYKEIKLINNVSDNIDTYIKSIKE